MASKIHFHNEDVNFKAPSATVLKKWLSHVANVENSSIKELNYIFCSDPYLLEINKEYLEHNYYTDIITFDNSETDGKIEGDIFISIDRVKENASSFNEEFHKEFLRVMVHGLLHLLGYKDKSKKEEQLMRLREDQYIKLYYEEFSK